MAVEDQIWEAWFFERLEEIVWVEGIAQRCR
jgi:hypothetical protein